MRMTVLLLLLYLIPSLAALLSGNGAAAGAAMLGGADEALRLCLSLAGGVCLWSAILELLERGGLAARLSRLLRVPLARLFPQASQDAEVLGALTENLCANLLGLGNAATPAGIRAAQGMVHLGVRCRDELCLLVVLNTASLQLLPTTVASLRAAAGAAAPFDILPAVWLCSVSSLAAGLGSAALLRRVWP